MLVQSNVQWIEPESNTVTLPIESLAHFVGLEDMADQFLIERHHSSGAARSLRVVVLAAIVLQVPPFRHEHNEITDIR